GVGGTGAELDPPPGTTADRGGPGGGGGLMSRIRAVTITEFAWRPPDAGRDSRKFAVRIETTDDEVGEYVALWSAPPLAVPQTVAAARMLIDQDPRDRERLWNRAARAHAKNDRIGYGALDIALWDLTGRSLGVPVWALLGRHRDRLPAYVSTVSGRKGAGARGSPEAYADYAAACAERGAPAYKFHGLADGDATDENAVLRAVAGRPGRGVARRAPGPAAGLRRHGLRAEGRRRPRQPGGVRRLRGGLRRARCAGVQVPRAGRRRRDRRDRGAAGRRGPGRRPDGRD